MIRETLDVQNLACPLPVLRANKRLRTMQPGDELAILATDPAAPADFASFCASAGHTLLSSDAEDDHFVIIIRKKD